MDILIYFKSLSDETRIRLLNVLMHHELSVNEIVTLMDMGQSRISRHLKILTDAGLLRCRRDGVWAFYSAAPEGAGRRFADAVRYLLAADETLSADLAKARKIVEERDVKSRDFFNTIASEWDRLKQAFIGDVDINAIILDAVQDSRTAADLGCGTGELLVHLKQRAGKVIGIDSSSEMLREARKKFAKDSRIVDFRLGELEHLPVGNEEVDLVVISMALHHLSVPEAAISEASRILQSGGRLIIADFDKHNNELMRKDYGDRWLGFSHKEIETMLEKNDFQIESLKSYDLKESLVLNIFKSIKTETPSGSAAC